jgi:hypothetical protein
MAGLISAAIAVAASTAKAAAVERSRVSIVYSP